MIHKQPQNTPSGLGFNILSNMPDTLVSGEINTNTVSPSPPLYNIREITLGGHKSCSVTIAGTWTGTLVVESSTDNGVTWVRSWLQSIAAVLSSSLLQPVNTINVNGAYSIFIVSGITHYRIRATTDTSWTGIANIDLTATEVIGSMFTASSVVQNELIDLNNTASSPEFNLNAGNNYTFTGRSTSILGTAGIQLQFFSDQNCKVIVQQSADNIYWDLIDIFYYYANKPFGITVQAISIYARIIVTSESLTTTVFRLNNILCPIAEVMPRSLNSVGYLRSGGFLNDISHGDVSSAIPWEKMGFTTTLTTTVFDLFGPGGIYTVPPDGGIQMRVASSSEFDTIDGTGCQEVTIYYLDHNYIEQLERVSLNGTNQVLTVATDIHRVNGFRVTKTGPLLVPVGNITLSNQTGTPGTIITDIIEVGFTRARTCFYTVPLGKTLYITKYNFSFAYVGGAHYCRLFSRMTYNNKELLNTSDQQLYYPYHEEVSNGGNFASDLPIPTMVPSLVDLKVSGTLDSIKVPTSAIVTCILRGYLIG